MDSTDIKFNPAMLSDRKKLILKAVVREYTATALPVGSAAIVKNYLPDVSSATVRNELASLEGLGLICQPHTSAGRIPTADGYRLFIDFLAEKRRLEAAEMIEIQNAMQQPITRFDSILRDVSTVLSELTGSASVALSPRISRCRIKSIRLVRLDSFNLVLIVFAEGDIVKHSHIKLEFPADEALVGAISTALSREFTNIRMEEISEEGFIRIMSAFRDSPELVGKILKLIIRAARDSADIGVTVSGTEHIFDFPNFSNIAGAKEFYRLLSDGAALRSIIAPHLKSGVSVILDSESGDGRLSGLSVFACRYLADNSGILAVISPMRCDYEKILAVMDYTARHLSRLVGRDSGKQMIIRRGGVMTTIL